MISIVLRLIAFIVLGSFIVRLVYRLQKKVFTGLKQNSKMAPASGYPLEKLKSCPTCGTFFQPSQGVLRNNKPYCTERCAGHHV